MKNSSKLHCKCLGFPQIQWEEQPFELNTLKSRALFIYLLVESCISPEQKIPREKLTDLLWPGMPLSSALQNLRQSLYQIRKALGQSGEDEAAWIIADRKTLSLNPAAPVHLDIAPLLNDSEILQDQWASLNPAVHLFLDNFYIPDSPEFDTWVEGIRAILLSRYRKRLEARVRAQQTQQQWETVAYHAQLLIKSEPLYELYYRWQMEALAKMKKTNQAIRVYKELESLLELELEGKPGPETQILYQQLQAGPGSVSKAFSLEVKPAEESRFPLKTLIRLSLWTLILAAIIAVFWVAFLKNNQEELSLSIAVLPFENTNDPDYIVSGLSDGIIEQLTRSPELKVISYYSSSRYKTDHPDLSEIAEELGVAYILTGKVQTIDDQMKITVHLIQAASGIHKWTKIFERPKDELSYFQQEIASGVKAQLSPQSKPIADTGRPTANQEAYDWYLKGRYVFYESNPDSLRKCLGYFRKALILDPKFTLARIHLAWTYCTLAGTWGDKSVDQIYEESMLHLETIKQEPLYQSSYHKIRGWLYLWSLDTENSLKELQKAVALNPNEEFGYAALSLLLTLSGRYEEAQKMALKAIDINPHFFWNYFCLADAHFFAAEYPEAERYARQSLQMNPKHISSHAILGRSLMAQGKKQEALDYFEGLDLKNPYLDGQRAIVYFHAGETKKTWEVLIKLEKAHQAGGKRQAYYIALIYNLLGETNKALDWLEIAIEDKESQLNWLGVDHEFRNLKAHPRFKKILKDRTRIFE